MPLPKKFRRPPSRGIPTRIPGSIMPPEPSSGQLPPSPRSAPRSPFTDLFPTFDVVAAYFTSITWPIFTFTNTDTIAYCLRSFRAGSDVRGDFSIFSVDGTMLPPDSGGIVPGGIPTAWGGGDTAAPTGREVGILIGVDLGVPANTWAIRNNLRLPGIAGHSAQAGVSLAQQPRLIHFEKFPIGTYTEPAIREKKFSRSFAPWVRRVPEGSSLDILLVGLGKAFSYEAGSQVNGYASIQVGIGLAENEQRFTE